MYKHQDPILKLYNRQLNESHGRYEDHRQVEIDKAGNANTPVIEPGLHVYDFDEVTLKDGSIVPGRVEFTADWENEDYENVDGRRYQTQSAGFGIGVVKVTIPSNVTQADLDSWTGKPGVFTPGADITALLTPNEVKYIDDHLTDHFNDGNRWGQPKHYAPDPRDNDDRD
jgi:hypothetical protein